ncbi:hypothetical protein SLNSH_23155 [Alsobacter soli]|uniref:Uncharacterized protein n=1 Tax=Alsobacter soli TaxID=2109933 RepID=A0A2T1HLS2_9HYPH|nr:hypothetical protein [Alsobacter soli]PSC02605.1 hypothetical protein SLNSH_23155 [Alsobacter soli]
MITEDQIRALAPHVCTVFLAKLAAKQVNHIEVRPTFEYGDITVVSYLLDAEKHNLYASYFGQPTLRVATCSDLDEALALAAQIAPFTANPEPWLNCQDFVMPYSRKLDIFEEWLELADDPELLLEHMSLTAGEVEEAKMRWPEHFDPNYENPEDDEEDDA